MSRRIALLRGINLGKHNRIGMAELRGMVDELGYTDVRTHLQSGNLILTGADSPEGTARKIEEQITRHLGLEIRVMVRTRDEIAAIVELDPLGEIVTDPARYLVTFFAEVPDPALLHRIDPSAHAPDVFRVDGREIYLWCAGGVRNTKLGNAFWEKQLGVAGTARNWNTVTRLLSLADD
ncbi:DUF1697 domain-containing protein [Parasphingorhabdus pacifica]